MKRRKKIIFLINNLNAGGAERVFKILVNEFDKNLFEVILILLKYDENKKEKYTLPDNAEVIILDKDKIKALPSIVKCIKKLKPDIVISTLTPINILSLLSKIIIREKKTKYIIRETTIKSISINQKHQSVFFQKNYKFIISRIYNLADSIISLSNGSEKDLINNFKVNKNKIKVIYNPININLIKEKSKESVNDINISNKIMISCVATLTQSKGHKYLIEAINILRNERDYDIGAIFIGEGKFKNNILNIRDKYNLQNDIHLLGFKENPYKYIKNSDIFVLPTLWEGFGNVIVESMACGIPVISTSCESGPKEIIKHNHNGILVEPQNSKLLADSIEDLINNKELYNDLIKNGFKRAEDFDSKKIVRRYEEHILQLF